jgi:hypothetical protein
MVSFGAICLIFNTAIWQMLFFSCASLQRIWSLAEFFSQKTLQLQRAVAIYMVFARGQCHRIRRVGNV